ncbi:MAG: DUF2183 domain-containing protein [Granulosicoccus sp.]|nr:DUF2183 domain-containing protein [Granulosicoccus sp.]
MAGEHWKALFHRLGMRTENALEAVAALTRQRLHPEVPLHIIAYRGFGARASSGWQGSLGGRVLKYRKHRQTHASELWRNLRASYARFDTREVAGVLVRGRVGDDTAEAITDEEGYFTLSFESMDQPPGAAELEVHITLPDFTGYRLDGDAMIVVPGSHARFGIISDIDDTLLVTRATSLLRMMRLTLLESSATRLAFDGVAEFYRALHDGRNPFFYVSSSPWNLYEFLTDFMRLNDIVPGPLMLRDFGIDESKFIAGSHREHKVAQIRAVMDQYPALPFILSGDSGQHDPEIYATICAEYPGRIQAIYIRDVSDHWRRQSVQSLITQLKQQNVDMLLLPDTIAAAQHAAAHGFIEQMSAESVIASVHQAQTTTRTPGSHTG